MSIHHFYVQKNNKFVKVRRGQLNEVETDFWVNLSPHSDSDECYFFQNLVSAIEFFLDGWKGRQIVFFGGRYWGHIGLESMSLTFNEQLIFQQSAFSSLSYSEEQFPDEGLRKASEMNARRLLEPDEVGFSTNIFAWIGSEFVEIDWKQAESLRYSVDISHTLPQSPHPVPDDVECYYFSDLVSALEFYLDGWKKRRFVDESQMSLRFNSMTLFSDGLRIYDRSNYRQQPRPSEPPSREGQNLRQAIEVIAQKILAGQFPLPPY